MYLVITFILLIIWAVGLSQNVIGGYINVFLMGSALAFFAHFLGKEQRRQIQR